MAVLIGPDGFIGKYRKTNLWNREKLIFTLGTSYPVFEARLARADRGKMRTTSVRGLETEPAHALSSFALDLGVTFGQFAEWYLTAAGTVHATPLIKHGFERLVVVAVSYRLR